MCTDGEFTDPVRMEKKVGGDSGCDLCRRFWQAKSGSCSGGDS